MMRGGSWCEAFRAASASGASYQGPPMDGSRPGVFYLNTYDLPARPRYGLESLFLHEAITSTSPCNGK